MEEIPNIQQSHVSVHEDRTQQQNNNKERRKSKKPKSQRQNQEEVCCTITTVPSQSSPSLEQPTKEEEDESKKLNCVTNHAVSSSTMLSKVLETKCDNNAENSMKGNSTDLQKPTPSLRSSEASAVIISEEKPITNIKSNIPYAPIADRKRVKDFLRRNKYKRPSTPHEGADLLLMPDVELLLKPLRSNSTSYQEAMDELKEKCEQLTGQVKQLKTDMSTELQRKFKEDYALEKDLRANAWYDANVEKYFKHITTDIYSSKDGNQPIDMTDACSHLQNMYRVLLAIVAKYVDKQLQKDRCNDSYADFLSLVRTQESIIDCHVNSTCAKNVGRNVLKNQIKILTCVYQYLLTKGLLAFSKRESTQLKTWRQTIQSYSSKQQQFTKTIQQMTSAIQKQRQSRERDHEELMKILKVEHKPLLKKFKESFDVYKARVMQSKQFKMLKEKHAGVRRSIVQRTTEITDLKHDLQTAHRQLEEERSKPKTYEALFAEWTKIKEELQSQSAKLKEQQLMKEELRAQILKNNGEIHRQELIEQDLKAELKRVDKKKNALQESHEKVMCDRKKLQMKLRQYQQQNFTLF